jgi:hypothetical protein
LFVVPLRFVVTLLLLLISVVVMIEYIAAFIDCSDVDGRFCSMFDDAGIRYGEKFTLRCCIVVLLMMMLLL